MTLLCIVVVLAVWYLSAVVISSLRRQIAELERRNAELKKELKYERVCSEDED